MAPPIKKNSLTYSLADQSFARTKSLGILNVSLDLLHALAARMEGRDLTVLMNDALRGAITPTPGMTVESHNRAAGDAWARVAWDQLGVYSAAARTGNEWLFLPKGFASFSRRPPVRLATFVHDMMHDHYDRFYPKDNSGLEAIYFRAALHATLRQSEVVFTPTEFTSRETERVAREKGWPIPRLVCCGEGFHRPDSAPPTERRGMVVLTGRFPHKLTKLAVDFLSRWYRENPSNEETHWVGSLPQGFELPTVPSWRRHARLPETEFRSLMSHAKVVFFFSDYEGFGRPPVEAVLAGGCPVYSGIAATHEVMEGRGCAFDNSDYPSFAAALDRALATSPEQLRIWADELYARHNWNDVAGRIVRELFE